MKNKIEELKKGCKGEFLNSTGEFRLKCGFKNLYPEYAYKHKVVFCPDCNNEIYIAEEAQKEFDEKVEKLREDIINLDKWNKGKEEAMAHISFVLEKIDKIFKGGNE